MPGFNAITRRLRNAAAGNTLEVNFCGSSGVESPLMWPFQVLALSLLEGAFARG